MVYLRLDRDEAAEKLFLETLAGKRRVLGPAHPGTALTELALARVYAKQRRFPKAEAAARAAYDTWRTRLGAEHPDTRSAAAQLATMYEEWGKPDAAAHWSGKK
jgi:hypothetical protein